jgi:hypothetical protein
MRISKIPALSVIQALDPTMRSAVSSREIGHPTKAIVRVGNMERDEALKLLKGGVEGVREWNQRRERNEEIPDLSRADLGGAYLISADLRGADLGGAYLSRAHLGDADLSQAACWGTSFGDVDLPEVKGLESIRHLGPSTVGVDTLVRSRGKIPEVFLRGCGVPDSFIVNLRALIGAMQPIQFSSCFISYSSRDQAFVERFHADLQGKCVRYWYAPEDLRIGAKTRVSIDESIRVHDKLLLVLSKNSVRAIGLRKKSRRRWRKNDNISESFSSRSASTMP